MKKNIKFIFLFLIVFLIALVFYFDLTQYLNLQFIKDQRDQMIQAYAENPLMVVGIYLAVYILSTALSLPGAAILTLLGGALFGLLWGTVIVSIASTTGATLAFLTSRFLLKDWVQERFKTYLTKINDGIKKEGAFYLFSLRLIPAVPFFVINLVLGLTPMKTSTFFFVSQVGMLAGTIVYVNAGTQLAQIDSLKGILSLPLILSFCALGLFPIAAKKGMEILKKK